MFKNKIAPIAIFAYNRSTHFAKTIQCLSKCDGFGESPITIYIDGPKNSEDEKKISKVRNIANELLGNYAEIKCRSSNIGLAESITLGVKEQLDVHDSIIVLEDDLLLSQNFLVFMSMALRHYAHDKNVFQISGFSYELSKLSSSNSAFFMPFTSTWGWATWARAWKSYDPLASGWKELKKDNALRKKFNLNGAYDYASMLEEQMINNIDSWGVRWYWSVFKKNGLVLFPPKSMVKNTGMDGTGVHGRGILTNHSGQIHANDLKIPNLPSETKINQKFFLFVKKMIWKQNGGYTLRIIKFFFNYIKLMKNFLKRGS